MSEQYRQILSATGNALRTARHAALKTVDEVAFEMGLPHALVLEMENGNYSPSFKTFIEWCEAVDHSPAQVLFISAELMGVNIDRAIMESWQLCNHRFAEARKSLLEMENALTRKEENLRQRFEKMYKPGAPNKGQNGDQKSRPEDN